MNGPRISPSTELRQWFGHDPAKWTEFRDRYTAELDGAEERWRPLLVRARKERVTILYGASDTEHNNAVVFEAYLRSAH